MLPGILLIAILTAICGILLDLVANAP